LQSFAYNIRRAYSIETFKRNSASKNSFWF